MHRFENMIRFIVLGLFIFLISCGNRENRNIRGEIVPVEVVRFEQELFNADLYSFGDSVAKLKSKYPDFMALYASRIIEIGDTSPGSFSERLSLFVTDQGIYELNKRVGEVYNDFNIYTRQLSKGFSRYIEFFPEKHIPVIYTYVSGLNQSIVAANDILGISLDKYLGAEEDLYNKVYPPISEYLRKKMGPDYVVVDAIRAWILSDINYAPLQDNFLSRILNEGKAIYITKQMLPEIHDSLLWGFTKEELDFCYTNENEMWKYLIEQKLLFSTDNFRISKFVEPGPFTKEFTNDSPARAAVWVGYRIIDKYMSRNKDITLSELVANNDFQYLLNESRYNP